MSPAALRADRKAASAGRSSAERTDIARQIAVIASVCFAIIGAAVGSGLAGGTNIRDLQGGALDADATLLAPGRPAFAIWSVIYLGLIAYAVWQALPARRASPRQRSVGWWIAGTAVLNGLWLVAAQYGTLWMTVVVIVLLLVALCLTFRRVVASAEDRSAWLDVALVDGVTGLHLGWVSLATVANLTAWLSTLVPSSWAGAGPVLAVVVLVVVLAIGLIASGATGWRIAPPWAMGWGVLWIGIERLTGSPHDALVGWTALVVAVLLFVVPTVLRLAVALRSGD
jgi:hypothetical protein